MLQAVDAWHASQPDSLGPDEAALRQAPLQHITGGDIAKRTTGNVTRAAVGHQRRHVFIDGYAAVAQLQRLQGQRAVVAVTADQVATRNFDLTTGIYKLEQFKVKGEREGDASALTAARNAENLKNVAATDSFGNLPNMNAGEVALRTDRAGESAARRTAFLTKNSDALAQEMLAQKVSMRPHAVHQYLRQRFSQEK